MGAPEADRFVGLRPFYQLCALGLSLTAINFVLVLWMATTRVEPAAVFAVFAVVLWTRWWRGQRRELAQKLARTSASERPRLKARLDALRARLQQFSGDEATRLVLVPDPAVVLSTVRSRGAPLVEVTAGFWTTYAEAPELVEAALAHEAGHIAARDVELFQRMLGMMRGLVVAFPLVNLVPPLGSMALHLLARALSWDEPPQPGRASLLHELGWFLTAWLQFNGPRAAISAVAVAFAWSALLLARELQADAFAVAVLGSERPVRALLETQLQRRQQQAPQRSLTRRWVTGLIQPDLRWRATLPALRGQLGPRVELLLGLASGGFVLSAVGTAFQLEQHLGGMGLFVMLVIPGVMGWMSWISYALFWGRSRAETDRGARGWLSDVGSVLRFSAAQLLVISLWLRMPWGEKEGEQRLWHDTEPKVLAFLLALSFALWAAGKLALWSEAERRRGRPHFFRGLGGLLAVGGVAWPLYGALWGLRAPGLEPDGIPDGSRVMAAAVLVASLLMGTLGHLRVRSASSGSR